MSEKRLYLLDASAMLAYLNREKGYQIVRDLLRQAEQKSLDVAASEINLGEVYYVLLSRKGRSMGSRLFATFCALPIERVPVDFDRIKEAAELRARVKASFADCIAAATAMRWKAILITRDPEFEQFEPGVSVQWL